MGNFEERFNKLEKMVSELCAAEEEDPCWDESDQDHQRIEYERRQSETSDYPTTEELKKSEQVFNNRYPHKPTDKEGIFLTEDTMRAQDYEFEIDVEGTTVYITRDIEVDNAYAVLQYTDVVHHMSEIELRRLLKWVEYSLSKK